MKLELTNKQETISKPS